jgi:hypothetical protein
MYPELAQYETSLAHAFAFISFALRRSLHAHNHMPVTCHRDPDLTESWCRMRDPIDTSTELTVWGGKSANTGLIWIARGSNNA